ncbi:hypothetical protein SAMN00768000_0828 [Sulfobacillus thermosulfidooxidans DSM 9293]|uniref:Uncharacterized protein n=1 Tax=Sulfobacillus thermosulfidooxidans (strain DSM 9293 / VKM B-1269 / AT-1) TaxID=929705 RepID=A0A1W1WA85_SULTA|nr:hypothetical protein [Sulfobacillus thermosulfidooxidans]SMC02950.1 hypothetical protein SAMN00768000_0828 [Sulfobacillus thermosulfidooxidans DSM 9293]
MRNLIKLCIALASILVIVAGGKMEHFHYLTKGMLLVSTGIITLSVVTGANTMVDRREI